MKTFKNKIERNPNYAVAYARFSSDRQREESIEAQEKAIKIYAEQNDITILEFYEDRAQSAKDDNRKEFQRMVKDMKTNQCGKIIAKRKHRCLYGSYHKVLYCSVCFILNRYHIRAKRNRYAGYCQQGRK